MHFGTGKLLMFCMVVFLMVGNLENKVTLYTRDKADNALVESTFAGTLCNVPRSFSTIEVIKTIQDDKVTYDFERMVQNSRIYIRDDVVWENVNKVMKQNVLLSRLEGSVDENYKIDSLIIYNCDDALTVISFNEGETNTVTKSLSSEIIRTPNDIVVEDTSIYVKASFDRTGILGETRRVFLERYVTLQYE